jgi:outer membrane protein OmpA-like peptidoglycan-associated protein
MAEQGQEPKADSDATPGEASPGAKLLAQAGEKLIPIFVSAGGLLGFVGFAGAVILWTRLEAVEIPPQQAINVAPQGELVTIGASYLLVLGFFGALATMGVFLVDRRARPTPGMAQALIGLLAFEGIGALIFVDGLSPLTTVVDCELLVLPLAAAFLATMISIFGDLEDDLERMSRELCGPERRDSLLWPAAGRERTRRFFVFGPIWLVGVTVAVALVLVLLGASDRLLFWVLTVVSVAFAVWFVLLMVADHRVAVERTRARRSDEERKEPPEPRDGEKKTGGLVKRIAACLFGDRAQDPAAKGSTAPKKPAPPPCGSCAESHEQPACGPTCDEKCREECDAKRRSLPRPRRLRLNTWGLAAIAATVAAGIVLVWLRLGKSEWWVAVSLTAAALIVAALWRISEQVNRRLVWFGVAVFLAVPLFGTLLTVVKNLAHPKVQPLALIRKTDGPRESIQGLYVAETGDRIYFANIATEGCGGDVVPQSGRLFSLPTSEVVAMSVGPLQSVEEAGKSALEMSYALTPSVETPGASFLLPGDEARQKTAEKEAEVKGHDTRLENAGPAVRPEFGAGLQLEPEGGEPGDPVTLTMSKPNGAIHGFGDRRKGRNVRIGGVVAPIVKELARRVEGAEYIQVTDGAETRFVALAKEGPYVRVDDEYRLLSEEPELADSEPQRYVKLEDPHLRFSEEEEEQADEAEGVFVKVDAEGGEAKVAAGDETTVTLTGGQIEGGSRPRLIAAPLAGRPLYRQAWHETRITFRIPDNALTGVVTVECAQLAGSPLLRVSHDPTARIAVRMRPHSSGVVLDGSRSSDKDEDEAEGDTLTLRWTVEGIRRGHGKMLTAHLPERDAPYTIELNTTDAEGHEDTAELHLLRLPGSTFAFDRSQPLHPVRLRAARRALVRAVRERPPASIEMDGHSDDPGTRAYNMKLSLERDEAVLRQMLPKDEEAPTVPVRELAYGETCPLVRRPGRQPRNRRVDIFVLDAGVTVVPPKGCQPGRIEAASWKSPGG